MNKERIKELAKEAGIQEDLVDHLKDEVEVLTYIARPQDIQKFAELLVEECAQRCDVVRESNGGDKQFGARLCADEIRWMNRRS
jgi:hypothetical protein